MIHKELAKERWGKMSLAEQMGNIGSEVDRAVGWMKKNNKEYADNAFIRALELLDLTVADARWSRGRKELARVREIIKDVFWGDNEYNIPMEWFQKYFFQFALSARRGR